MSGPPLYLVRHAAVTVRPDRPGALWHLSPEGRAAAEALATAPYWAELAALHTSSEPKAVATAQRITAPHGLPLQTEPDLREVGGRGRVEQGYEQQVERYLSGEAVDGWEPHDAALARVRGRIDGIVRTSEASNVGVVSHGLVLTLYLSDVLGLDGSAAFALWSSIHFPDVATIDLQTRTLVRAFGG